MLNIAEKLISLGLAAIEKCNSLEELEQLRVNLLGKKGELTLLLKQLGTLEQEQRILLGNLLNQGKHQLQSKILAKKQLLLAKGLDQDLVKGKIDLTLPPIGIELGGLHPITNTFAKAVNLFEKLGFEISSGPEIEDQYYNFEALNIPWHHPARAMHDTFYFPDGKLLRTHTSTVQIRAMQQSPPPYKMISLGKVYRCDSDLTHTPMFHQIEGLLIGTEINFGNLIYTLTEFLRAFFFVPDLSVRFRPSYFPFTEPSAEVDMQCVICNSNGCKVCKYTGWIEILGCGMVHPEVLKNCHLEPAEWSGWAFGIGTDRLTMLRYGIDDLRLMFENDLRFLKQFQGV